MSMHKSLKLRNSLVRRRNVLSRGERIQRLKAEERWVEGEMSVFGLPKVKSQVVSAPGKPAKKKEKAAEGVAVAGTPGAEGASKAGGASGAGGARGASAGGAAAAQAPPKRK
jgi:small basic protein (TIGR04137 family)